MLCELGPAGGLLCYSQAGGTETMEKILRGTPEAVPLGALPCQTSRAKQDWGSPETQLAGTPKADVLPVSGGSLCPGAVPCLCWQPPLSQRHCKTSSPTAFGPQREAGSF